MSSLALDRLSREDAQILKLEGDVIRGHTCKVLVLEPAAEGPPPTVAALRDHVERRLDLAPRFRQRVVRTPLAIADPIWFDDPEFDIARHVTALAGDRELDHRGFEELVALRMSQPLDLSHPLWHLDVIEDRGDGKAALIWRVHHCLADGTTCMRLGAALLWGPDTKTDPPPHGWWPAPSPSRATLLARGVAYRASNSARRARVGTLRSPRPAGVERVIRRELRPTASLTPFAGRVSSTRTVALCDAPLEQCKLAGKAAGEGVTVNDVVLAVIAGAVGNWLRDHHRSGDLIRVKVPVSLHHRDEAQSISNHNSYFFVDLPVAESDPRKRVRAINEETKERKLEHDAETLYRLGAHPLIARWAMSPHVFTFNVSNVPGPREDIQVLGAPVRELYSIAEVAQHHALRIAVISASGRLFFGLCADQHAVGDLGPLADGLRRSRDEFLRLAS